MLNVNDLIGIDHIPTEDEVTLKLYTEFYNMYLSNRISKFELETGTVIKLFFKDVSEIFHVSGIKHIYKDTPMNGTRFIKEVKEGRITFETLRRVNHNAYTDYSDRILGYLCIDTIIKNCEYLWFSKGIIEGTKIKVSYLLFRGVGGKNLHLGIDTYKPDRPYFTKTLLVTERNTGTKFIDKADNKIKVTKIDIIEKSSEKVLEVIQRKKAYGECRILINGVIDKWCTIYIEDLILNYYKEKLLVISNQDWLKNAKQTIDLNRTEIYELVIKEINENDEINECISERNKLNGKERMEWEEVLKQLYSEHINYDCYWVNAFRKILMKNPELINNNILSLRNQIIKKKITGRIASELKNKRPGIIYSISVHDKYWAERIYREVSEDELKNWSKIYEYYDRFIEKRIMDIRKLYIEGIINTVLVEVVEGYRIAIMEYIN